MATLAKHSPMPPMTSDNRFFMTSALIMTLVIVAGFSMQIAMGRSSFAAPLLVHAHAIVFMGWVAIYVAQAATATSGNRSLHRGLGWLATGWVVAMLVLGIMVVIGIVRRGQAPFFFRPQQFLVFDPVTLFAFAGLTAAAVVHRRQTAWHRRLHYCAMALLLGPAVGRLIPMPLLAPWAFEATFVVILLFPLAGIIADRRRTGRVHPAWSWGIGAMFAALVVTEALTYSPVGDALYRATVAGHPGATVDGLAFPPPPPGGLVTGRTGSS